MDDGAQLVAPVPTHRVVLPAPSYWVIEFVQEGRPGIAEVNVGLRDFQPRVVFGWHCSVMLHFEDVTGDGTPSAADAALADGFEAALDAAVKGSTVAKPNALPLARITWAGTRELIWRVCDPAPVAALLEERIARRDYALLFDYRLDRDVEWALAEWHLRDRLAGQSPR